MSAPKAESACPLCRHVGDHGPGCMEANAPKCAVCGGAVVPFELWQEATPGGVRYGHRSCIENVPADLVARLRNILDYPTTNITLPKTGDVVKMIHPDLLREAVEALEAANGAGLVERSDPNRENQ